MALYTCNQCGRKLKVSDKYAGNTLTCKQCGCSITIPQPKKKEINGFDTSFDPCDMFMKKNREIFKAMLRHEKEAPAVEVE